MPEDPKISKNPRHPIGVVSSRTGIPQDVLRAWEKRYNAVIPTRSATGRRLYTDGDIDKLRLLKNAVAAGRRISDVAAMSLDKLNDLVDEDRKQAVLPGKRERAAGGDRKGYLAEVLSALEAFDVDLLEKTLESAAVSLGLPALRRQVFIPLLQTVGDRWQDGSLRIVHEHVASAVVRSFLERMAKNGGSPASPHVLVTTPSGQRHELGALIAGAVALEHGWNVGYLGPDLPAEEIAAAVKNIRPRAVALSVVYADGLLQLQEEFRKLRRYLDENVAVVAGGRAVAAMKPFFDSLGITTVNDLGDFPGVLSSLTA